VLEIGPGLGALTRGLLETGARVTAIEIDARVGAYLRETLGANANLTLLEGDALDFAWEEIAPEPVVLVANLPYAITGPILDRLVRHAPRIQRALLMVQREVAQRIASGAGGKEIGAPTVHVRLLYEVERLFDVGAGAFHPPPDVVSTVVRFVPRAGARLDPGLRETVNRAYRQRRKTLRKTLADETRSEDAIARALDAIGHSATARPEELEPDDWPRFLAALDEGNA
jgi:16S rRNA (adenine1518-N6/adenine1519-N6)-dimethyltransferase